MATLRIHFVNRLELVSCILSGMSCQPKSGSEKMKWRSKLSYIRIYFLCRLSASITFRTFHGRFYCRKSRSGTCLLLLPVATAAIVRNVVSGVERERGCEKIAPTQQFEIKTSSLWFSYGRYNRRKYIMDVWTFTFDTDECFDDKKPKHVSHHGNF